jgi:hypothetical protein
MTTATAPAPTAVDILDEAMTAPPPPSLERTYFGQVVIVDAWACALIKGVGKVPFDPGIHEPRQRAIAVKLGIACESKDGTGYSVDQDAVTSSTEWREFTLPSIAAIGKDLKTLNGCYVQVSRKPTGVSYTNSSGEKKDRTALVFHAVYPDKDAIQTAADVFYTRPLPSKEEVEEAVQNIRKTPTPAPAQPAIAADRATLATFLDMLWQVAGQDKAKFVGLVQGQAHLAPFHDVTAPEMVKFVGDDYDDMPF